MTVESAHRAARGKRRRARAAASDSHLRRLASVAAIVAAVGASLASPSDASAETFCVGSPPGCVGTVKSNLQDALDAADANGANKDTIRVGVGLFTTYCPCTDVAGNPVEIIGVATNQTALSTPSATNTNTVLTVDEPTSEISHLRAHMRGGDLMTGFDLRGRAEDVLATNQGGAGITGVKMVGTNAELVDSAVDIIYSAASTNNRAVVALSGADALIEDSFLSAVVGVAATTGDAVVRRTEIDADQGVVASGGSNTTVYDSLIDTPGPYSSGLQTAALASAGTGTTTLGAERLTMHASAAGARGVWVTPNGAGDNASANVQSSVLNGFSTDLYEFHSGGASGSINVDWSAYSFASKIGNVSAGPNNLNISGVDPKFVDPSIGDFQLRYDSQLVDRGNPIFLGVPLDLESRPRVVDGDGNGSSRLDIGALEYQHTNPTAAASATPATAQTGESVTFGGSGSSDPDPGDVLAFSWSFDDGGTAAGQSVQHVFATPGTHAGTLTVKDPTGLTAQATATVAVSSPAVSGLGPPVSAPVAPSLTDLRIGPKRFRAASATAAARKRRRTSAGSAISYRISEDATLTFTVERVLKGRRAKGKCRSLKSGHKAKRRCKRYRKAGSFAAQGLSGANRLPFSGRVRGKRLRPARYRLSGQALDGDGLQSTVARANFTIARR